MQDSLDTTVEQWLRDWFADRAPDVDLGPDEDYFAKGALDSFGAIELIEAAEEQFGIRFSEQDFQDRGFSSLGGLARIIQSKREA